MKTLVYPLITASGGCFRWALDYDLKPLFVTPKVPVVTPVFLENNRGKAKIVSFFAKKARGAMARFIVQNRLKERDQLQDFNAGGYRYQPNRSDEDNIVFLRDAAV